MKHKDHWETFGAQWDDINIKHFIEKTLRHWQTYRNHSWEVQIHVGMAEYCIRVISKHNVTSTTSFTVCVPRTSVQTDLREARLRLDRALAGIQVELGCLTADVDQPGLSYAKGTIS